MAVTDVTADPSATTASIKYSFDENILYRIKEFRVDLTSMNRQTLIMHRGPDSRTVNFSGLDPGRSYEIKVVAVYTDDTTAVAETTFQTLGMIPLQHINLVCFKN